MGWRGRWEVGSGWGTHVNPWLIHVNVWQKPLQYCKVISLQLIKIKEKKIKGFPGGVSGKRTPSANAGDIRDQDLIPGSGRSPGGGHGNPFPCSCLENPVDRGAWRATVHGIAKSWTQLKQLSTHT